jgi:hypothetical protein
MVMSEDSQLRFRPSFGTCYRIDLNNKNQCDKCEFKEYVLCKNSPNYQQAKEEMEKEEKQKERRNN